MSCWKCGKNIEGMECEPSCEEPVIHLSQSDWVSIDWSKVNKIEDIIEIFKVVEVHIDRNHPKYQRLKRFVKE